MSASQAWLAKENGVDDRLRVALLRKRCLRKLAFVFKFELHDVLCVCREAE